MPHTTASKRTERPEPPPAVLRLVAHPVRWQLLGELADSDRPVRELTDLLGHPQSLVSYHLRELRKAGLVTSRRSSADGRDSYYAVDLGRCGELLRAAGTTLHPGLSAAPVDTPSVVPDGAVLFLCTGNGSRSQIAEALLRDLTDGTVEVVSAGSHPKPVHPNAVRVLAERGIDISGARSKHLDEFADRRFDAVVTLCDRVREVCPDRDGPHRRVHWSIADPSLVGESPEDSYPAFEQTTEELERRIRFLIAAIWN
ncbi:metalloregulator ArsR/SmtB family transcription factor [Dermatobacter hominis]|uniref:metalloregulator ArsR/SmtB family transcription factor n=1 Tax=Dermatobacter hominis TaxID=2884263 RepID=UPI001D12BCE8|nr:metalloregulator ArsR/SmtB family transcription factor [Dermatobacter hominis]UDY37060.1 metalloregulator ArsR/SmtB family transcription factor [Dermatobacter hominis]